MSYLGSVGDAYGTLVDLLRRVEAGKAGTLDAAIAQAQLVREDNPDAAVALLTSPDVAQAALSTGRMNELVDVVNTVRRRGLGEAWSSSVPGNFFGYDLVTPVGPFQTFTAALNRNQSAYDGAWLGAFRDAQEVAARNAALSPGEVWAASGYEEHKARQQAWTGLEKALAITGASLATVFSGGMAAPMLASTVYETMYSPESYGWVPT